MFGDLHPSELTPHTISAIQLLTPKFANADKIAIKEALNSLEVSAPGEERYAIFPGVTTQERHGLRGRLVTCSRILSFYSFVEGTIYLEACHSSLKWLVPDRQAYDDSDDGSDDDGFEKAFFGILPERKAHSVNRTYSSGYSPCGISQNSQTSLLVDHLKTRASQSH